MPTVGELPPLPDGLTPIEGRPGLAYDADSRAWSCLRPGGGYAKRWTQMNRKWAQRTGVWALIPPRPDREVIPEPPEGFSHIPGRPGLAKHPAGWVVTCQRSKPSADPSQRVYRDRWQLLHTPPRKVKGGEQPAVPAAPPAVPRPPAVPTRTKAEREAMLEGVRPLVASLVRRSGLPHREHEDAIQDGLLEAWRATERFDAARGVKFSTFAAAIVGRLLKDAVRRLRNGPGAAVDIPPEAWAAFVAPSVADPDRDETADQLFDAVQRQLTAGLLDAATAVPTATAEPDAATLARLGIDPPRTRTKPDRAEPPPAAVDNPLSHRGIVEAVAFGGLTCDDLATQHGQPVKVVRTNLKNLLRKMRSKGLTQHVASDALVEEILVPDEKHRHANKPNRPAPSGFLPPPWTPPKVVPSEAQERICPHTPATEVPTCPA